MPPNAPRANAPGTTAPILDAPFKNSPSWIKLWRSLQQSPTQHGRCQWKKYLGKYDPQPKIFEAQTPPHANPPPPGNGIYRLKRFGSKGPTTYTSKKHVINRNKENQRWGHWCKFVFLLILCLYFNSHFVNILIYKSVFVYLLMYIFPISK